MKHSLLDLNEYLFDQIDRLSNDDLDEAALEKEIQRGEAISKVASSIIQNAQVQVSAAKVIAEYTSGSVMETKNALTCLIEAKE